MTLLELSTAAQASAVGEWMRTSVKAMPFVEAIHVMAVAVVFGTVLVVDLRLLGFPDARRAITRVADELLWLTWVAFGVAVVTGAAMFTANAVTYYNNTAFRLKLLALLAAGVNMAFFQLLTWRSVRAWDQGQPSPSAARLAAVLSILLWISVIFLGRWIGFTKGYDFTIPDEVQFDFGGP
jgi:hypothetical protein